MNCPSCNFKNIEENRFCIMCGTPLEEGSGGETTGSLDLSASLPGGADIDFSGLMENMNSSDGNLFEGFEDVASNSGADGGLDLMLSDFEGNLNSMASESPSQSDAMPPPSGGEGWGLGAEESQSFGEFSFSDLSALDPEPEGDLSIPDGISMEPATLTDLTPKVDTASLAPPAGDGLDLPEDDLFASGSGDALDFSGFDSGSSDGSGGGDTGSLFGFEDSLSEFDSLATSTAATGMNAVGTISGDDELEALLAEIDDTGAPAEAAAPAAAPAPQAEELVQEVGSDVDDFSDLFGGGDEGENQPGSTLAFDPSSQGLLFPEDPTPEAPAAAKSDPLDDSLAGFDDLDDFFADDAGAKAAAVPEAPPAPPAQASDDLDDFLAELEETTGPADSVPELEEIMAPSKAPSFEAAPSPAPARAKLMPPAPSADASDDEIAALIAGMEKPKDEDERFEMDPASILDAGESGPPVGDSLDNFLDELTGGVVPPDPIATGPSQPMDAPGGFDAGPTALTPVPARLEEIDPKVLIEQLEKAKDEDRRYQIVQRLAQLHHPDTSPEFLHLINDKNLDVRECAVEALGNLSDPHALRPLLKVLRTERGNIRYLAVESLGKLGDRDAVEPLIELLDENDENMAYVVAEALGGIGDDRAVRPLIGLSAQADRDLRYVIARSLGSIGSTEATPILLNFLRDNDLEVRTQAIRSLGEIEDPEGAGALIDFLDVDLDAEVVLEAVRSLGRMRSRVAVNPLLNLLKVDREDLVVEVISSLGQIGEVEAVGPICERVAEETSLPIQIAAIKALGDLGSGEGIPALADLLASEKVVLKVPIAEALAKINVPEALSPLEELLQDADVVVRKYAVEGIGSLQNPSSVTHLERLVKDPDEGVRQAVAISLGRIGVEPTLPLLLNLLKDPADLVSDAAIEGLEQIGTPAIPSLVETLELEGENSEIVSKITRVLGSIGDIRGINPLLEVYTDADGQSQERIAEALVAIDRKLIDTGRISTLLKEGYAWCRFRIADALGRSQNAVALDMLLDIIRETYTPEDEKRLKLYPDEGVLLVNREALSGVRSASARLLGDLDLPDTVKSVLAHLVQSEGDTQLWFVRTLGFIHKEASISALIELVKKEDSGIPALFLGKVLKRIPLEITVERVLGALTSASAAVRARCSEVLGVLQDVKALGKLGELTKDPDEEVRLASIGALERIGSNQAFEYLSRAVKDVSSTVRGRAVEALQKIPDDRAIHVLGTALQDRVAAVRRSAAGALSAIRDKRVVPILLAGLKDESSEVRLSIVNTLAVLEDASAVKPLIQMLQDINSEVRQAAVRALGKIRDTEAVQPLLRAMLDKDLWVKTEARKTLLNFGEISLAKKIEALGLDDEEMQWNAVAILAEEDSPRLYRMLLETFRHRSKSMRANAARVLGLLRETKAVVPLIQLLDDRDFEVREKAAVALGEIGDISASVALRHAQKDQNKDVRVAAGHALKKIMELADVG